MNTLLLTSIAGLFFASSLVAASGSKVGQRYTEYLKLCKTFRLKQMQHKAFQDAPQKFEKCRNLAEIYADLEPQKEIKELCSLAVCYKEGKKEEVCRGEKFEHTGFRHNTCRRVLAPLACMKAEKLPFSVRWSYDQQRGKISCLRI